MSWEGYIQCLCENGHQFGVGPYDEDMCCDICKGKITWSHPVDETNGCCCDDNSCCAHPLPLKVKTPAEYKECPTCHHKELVKHETYYKPGE
jgi:hypothetical protein